MTGPRRVAIEFLPREAILEPVAVLGLGVVARRLAERLLRYEAEDLKRWRGVAGRGVIAVLGPGERLPWVDGVAYLGRDPRAPQLLLPTTLGPRGLPAELLERAILQQAAQLVPPLAVLAFPPRILSLAAALPIARGRLSAWLEAQP
jgi:hypothetical protein